MHTIRSGDPLAFGVTGFAEGTHYNYTRGGHSLILSIKDPSPSEVAAVKAGDAVFCLTTREEAVFLVCRFGDLPWRVAHYNWWINPMMVRPDPQTDSRLASNVSLGTMLVDASHGTICALRSLKLSPEFSDVLLSSVEAQMKPRFDPWRYLEVVDAALREHPGGKGLLKEAACLCTCSKRSDLPLHGHAVLAGHSVH